MSFLGELEHQVRALGNLSIYDDTHLHRASREDAMGRIRGRDRLRDKALASLAQEGRGPITIEAESRDMLAVKTNGGWRCHRWVVRQAERVISETEILDGAARASALGLPVDDAAAALGGTAPMHAPLGELRPGRGQLAASTEPALPCGFPDAAIPAARWLDRFWNARALHIAPISWEGPAEAGDDCFTFALKLLSALPDAVCLIERASVVGNRIALLWRLHGHHLGHGFGEPSSRRVRLIGSSILTLDGPDVVAEQMLIDTLALRATAYRPMVDYVVCD